MWTFLVIWLLANGTQEKEWSKGYVTRAACEAARQQAFEAQKAPDAGGFLIGACRKAP